MTTFDLDLFLALNAEYKDKPLVPAAPRYDADSLAARGKKRADDVFAIMGKPGRVLEIGCGHGEVSRHLATRHGCTAVGVEVSDYPDWDRPVPGVTLLKHDLAQAPLPDQEPFDLIYSNSVFEHVVHPFSMLKAARDHLRPGGRMVLNINLYRGPKASHRYGEVFFPWPHILFDDDVFRAFSASIGRHPSGAAWVNQLSIADYFRYFDMLGLDRVVTRFSRTPLDRPFYERFADQLERFPIYDLERDFLRVQLVKPETPRGEFVEHTVLLRERDALQRRLGTTQERLATVQDRVGAMQGRVATVQDRAAALQDRLGSMTDRVATLQERLDKAQSQLAASHDRAERFKARAETMTERVTKLTADRERLTARHAAAVRDAAALRDAAAKQKAAAAAQKAAAPARPDPVPRRGLARRIAGRLRRILRSGRS